MLNYTFVPPIWIICPHEGLRLRIAIESELLGTITDGEQLETITRYQRFSTSPANGDFIEGVAAVTSSAGLVIGIHRRLYVTWLAIPIWWLGQTDLLLGNSLSAKKPKSMNAVYWYEEWFETVENSEAEENIEPTIEIVEPTIIPEIVVQEVVQGKRKPKQNPTSAKQIKLFNLDDFS